MKHLKQIIPARVRNIVKILDTNLRQKKALTLLLFVVGNVLVIFGVYGTLQKHTATTGTPVLPAPNSIATSDFVTPEEKRPTLEQPYEVAANKPRRIILPKLAAEGFVQQVGLDASNRIVAPSNVHIAGWYTGSVLPGQQGLSVIDGHVSGKYTKGIFYDLNKLQAGDSITIEYGNKSTKNFKVISKKQLTESDAGPFLLQKNDSIDAQLNLITCSGKFDRAKQQYEDRIIIVTKLAE